MVDDLSIDVPLAALLDEWTPRIGRPTCGPGCSNCCERMTVLITAPEAIAIASESTDVWSGRIEGLEVSEDATPEEARNALLDQGPCVFLDSGNCGVYQDRPDACSACNVWHEAWYCGRPDWEMCTPAELNQLRIESAYRRMLREIEGGRRPFWGYLLPATALAFEHGGAYGTGADLRGFTPEAWLRSELIEFPTKERLLDEMADHARTFRLEANPMGSPRGSDAPNRQYLAPFREDD